MTLLWEVKHGALMQPVLCGFIVSMLYCIKAYEITICTVQKILEFQFI